MHALVFDLDGTLVDTVYVHVLAWQLALGEVGVVVDGYRLHRHVGSSGELIVPYAEREAGRELSTEQAQVVHQRREELFRQLLFSFLRGILRCAPCLPPARTPIFLVNRASAITAGVSPWSSCSW